MLVNLTADIYAIAANSAYRLFINDILLTERTFLWDVNNTYVEENIIIDAEEKTQYVIRAESLPIPDQIIIKNVCLEGKKVDTTFECGLGK